MERRHFLKVAIGFAAGAATLAAAAHAAPLSLHPLVPDRGPPLENDAQPAVTSEAEVEQLKPEQVRHGHGHAPPALGLASPSLGLAPPPLGLAPPALASPLLLNSAPAANAQNKTPRERGFVIT